jgi:hypothetical protein
MEYFARPHALDGLAELGKDWEIACQRVVCHTGKDETEMEL